jgi:VanZ family protein
VRPRLRPSVIRLAPAVAWMALIFVLSAQPGLRVSDDVSVDGPIRHAAHVIVYAILALLLLWGFDTLSSGPRTRLALIAGLLAFLYGITDELHQLTVPNRTGQAFDLVWDALGSGIGVVVGLALARRRSAAERRRSAAERRRSAAG